MNEIGSWMTGVNGNVECEQKPPDHALHRRASRVSRALRRCGGGRRPYARAGIAKLCAELAEEHRQLQELVASSSTGN